MVTVSFLLPLLFICTSSFELEPRLVSCSESNPQCLRNPRMWQTNIIYILCVCFKTGIVLSFTSTCRMLSRCYTLIGRFLVLFPVIFVVTAIIVLKSSAVRLLFRLALSSIECMDLDPYKTACSSHLSEWRPIREAFMALLENLPFFYCYFP